MAKSFDDNDLRDMGALVEVQGFAASALMDSSDPRLNTAIYKSLEDKAKPEDIKTCVSAYQSELVVQYHGLFKIHRIVTSYNLPGVDSEF